MQVFEDKRINEKVYVEELPNKMQIMVVPKHNTQNKYIIWATKFGSIDNHFIDPTTNEETVVPDGIAHYLEHKMFEQKSGVDSLYTLMGLGLNANAYTTSDHTAYLFGGVDNFYPGLDELMDYVQNPYYTDMKSYIDNNNVNIDNDTVMQKGYANYWANTTVVYGAIWTFICSVISFLSFGNIDFGLLIFKLINLGVHLANCYLIYKISNRKLFTLIYGLNPFVLIEGIANVHNDIFVVFFMLLSIYEVYKKKNLTLGMLFLALSTDIKYFSILLLPFLIIYHFREKDVKIRILKCIQYGILFVIFAMIPYLLYIRDFNVFLGLSEQRERLAKGLYLFISEYFNNPENFLQIVKNTSLILFAILYIVACVMLLLKKNIKQYTNMRELFWFVLAFLMLLITNFQPWYFMWLVPFMMWQKSENIKLIVQMQIMTLIANIVFLIYSENYKYGVPFFTIFVVGTLACVIQNKNSKIRRLSK